MNHLTNDTLNQYLDHTLSAADQTAAAAHLDACPACRAELARLQDLFARLDAVAELPLSTDLTAQIMAALPPEPEPDPASWPVWVMVLQTAVSLILTATLWPTIAALLAQAGQTTRAFLAASAPTWPTWASITAWLATLTAQRPDLPVLNLPAVQWGLLVGLTLLLWLVTNRLLLAPPTPNGGTHA